MYLQEQRDNLFGLGQGLWDEWGVEVSNISIFNNVTSQLQQSKPNNSECLKIWQTILHYNMLKQYNNIIFHELIF